MNQVSEVDDEYYGGESPLESNRDGYTTYEEPRDSPLGDAVTDFLIEHIQSEDKQTQSRYRYENTVWNNTKDESLIFTVHKCWSGYSEYTITSTWAEISFKWGPYEHHFPSMGEFFQTLSKSSSGDYR